MLKNTFLLLSTCILLFGCKSNKDNNSIIEHEINEITVEIENQNYRDNKRSVIEIMNHRNYYRDSKLFYVRSEADLIFLANFTQDELSEFIDCLSIGSYIGPINFLENFTYIKYLDLDNGGRIANIEVFKYLSNIELLIINGIKKYVDLSPISNLENLKNLTLRYCDVDISPISNLKNLEALYLYSNEIENLNTIYELINLKSLRFNWQKNNIDLTHIGKLQNLEYLDLPFIIQDNLNLLINLKQLKTLEIDRFIGSDIIFLLQLPRLEKLRINYDGSIDYLPLVNSNSLKEIWFVGWDSYDDWSDFVNNKMSIFEKNGIYTPLDAKIWE
jgi:Leucine-rich repeat (LRR) protein